MVPGCAVTADTRARPVGHEDEMRARHDAPLISTRFTTHFSSRKETPMQGSITSARRRFAGTLISVALASFASIAAAEPGYLTTGGGNHVKTLTGLCVHTGDRNPRH